WLPPSASPVSRAPPPTGPSYGQNQQSEGRPNFPGPQGAPRPLGYAGPLRQAPAGEFPRYQDRRPSAPPSQQAPATGPRTIPPQRPNPASTQPSPTAPRPDTARQPPVAKQTDQSELQLGATPTSPSGGEMDWDTALDAILKTLRKDKVEEKQ